MAQRSCKWTQMGKVFDPSPKTSLSMLGTRRCVHACDQSWLRLSMNCDVKNLLGEPVCLTLSLMGEINMLKKTQANTSVTSTVGSL